MNKSSSSQQANELIDQLNNLQDRDIKQLIYKQIRQHRDVYKQIFREETEKRVFYKLTKWKNDCLEQNKEINWTKADNIVDQLKADNSLCPSLWTSTEKTLMIDQILVKVLVDHCKKVWEKQIVKADSYEDFYYNELLIDMLNESENGEEIISIARPLCKRIKIQKIIEGIVTILNRSIRQNDNNLKSIYKWISSHYCAWNFLLFNNYYDS